MARDSDNSSRFDDLLAGSKLRRAEVRALLEAASGRSREWLIAHGNELAPADVVSTYRQLEASRLNGTPLAYLTGEREFFGHRINVTPDVLIPRIETEMLVSLAIEQAPVNSHIIELGTGSGAIAVSIAIERPDLQITATDLSGPAIAVAQANAIQHGVDICFRQGSWWAAVTEGEKFSLAISNPPYLAADDGHLKLGDLPIEPQMALVSGQNGLDAIESIVSGAQGHMLPGGLLIVEHGWQQAGAVQAVMVKAGLQEITSRQDDQTQWRVTTGRSPAPKTVV